MPDPDPLNPNSLWYKDAVFYELHVKAFQDSNDDGIGDFGGLMERLDYIESLGVDCIWLLPCYPSPLRDDGYDIADYYGVHPAYGTLDDFERFIDEAHRRGLRVIADLVLNHTSDQHPWFQRARHAPPGSPERDFYVWSDTGTRYPEVRIIFTDTERSNWTWDPVAGQYYWHRFFHHQPDLNWDNPAVEQAMFEVMDFWLERGLDGFRADAVPYLIEREATNCENLPETHAILKRLRAHIEKEYPGRILLAEANQWPDDVRPYFGDGDEFHMAFHFPLMPRIFMAVRQGIRRPITEIIERTPEIPADCQWCMFLRNHDELTLEMVTDEERDYMYAEYANDPRMRLNLGIRRRLAPLMENDRRRIELLNSILFTMPGSPVVYYGDELAMGDNIYLGDRDGVRTPMQWSPDRNGGFSRAETARLYLPAIVDSQYGFQSINVEAQQQSPFSLLNWMRRLIQVRKQHRAFGRGGIRFLRPENPHILAYLREYDGDDILLVHNLSGSAQAVRLDLAEFAGARPVELLGGTEFLPVDETPYALTLAPYGFFWFSLRRDVGSADSPLDVAGLVAAMPRQWLRQQRWFRSKARGITELELWDRAPLGEEQGELSVLTVLLVEYSDAPPERYLLPLLARRGDADGAGVQAIAIASGEAGDVRLFDGAADARTGGLLLEAIADERELPSRRGRFVVHRTGAFPPGPLPEVRRMTLEQSNTSIVFGESLILKIFRILETGINPELELPLYLTEETEFGAIPPVAGWIDYEIGGKSAPGAVLTSWVANRGDGWSYTLQRLEAFFAALPGGVEGAEEPTSVGVEERAHGYLNEVELLGDTIARLHLALAAAPRDRAELAPEPLTDEDVTRWTQAAHTQVATVLGEVAARIESIPGAVAPALLPELEAAVRAEPHAKLLLNGIQRLEEGGTIKTRLHGDLHLGQLLRAAGGGDESEPWYVIDFEGEPIRSLAERRAKNTPLRDVAGILRSFSYAACTAETAWRRMHADEDPERIRSWAGAWEREVRERFLSAYLERADRAPFLPSDPAAVREVLAALELDKAVYELGYELNNRPEWMWIPLRALPKNAA